MKKINSSNYAIYFSENGYKELITFVEEKKYSKIFVLTDTNTHECCVYSFLQKIPFEVEIIEIEAGEIYKNIETCVSLWQTLSELGADRKSVMINLGGGVVTDLGGFVASTYMRGIDFINIPTSLLAMVDASVGGKTGIDLGTLKNQIGVINTPKFLLIDVNFLGTLPKQEFCSGLAEMFKHGLIQSEDYWNKIKNLHSLTTDDLEEIIYESILLKNNIVEQDPTEKGLRKVLNFGHTLGHAIESFCLENRKKPLLHGEAIAIGMVLAAYLSKKIVAFSEEKLTEIKQILAEYFPVETFTQKEIEQIINLLQYDKKNAYGKLNFVLLEDIAQPKWDIQVPTEFIYEAFDFYKNK
ncbi:MAG: 3-dehydroquinate synthase [Capnocytophaga sp.]|nr:3-dehydroquinate synthase [Capnocytophaga sp.]